jgi:GcrA cell cycle regulator
MIWTTGLIEVVQRLYAQGRSQSQIADVIGGDCTRNAVAGKISRLGLCQSSRPRHKPTFEREPYVFRSRVEPMHKLKPKPKRKPGSPHPPVTFHELAPTHCRWPSGHSPRLTFCGEFRRAGSPYCEDHHKLAYYPPRARGQSPT